MGVNKEGIKDLIGVYISESEGANFWLSVLTDLQNRGVKDILIACTDNLNGFEQAILSVYPKADVQSCVVH
jgi:transposase-like protein